MFSLFKDPNLRIGRLPVGYPNLPSRCLRSAIGTTTKPEDLLLLCWLLRSGRLLAARWHDVLHAHVSD